MKRERSKKAAKKAAAKKAPKLAAIEPPTPEAIAEFIESAGRLVLGRVMLAQLMGVHPDSLSHWAGEGMPVLVHGGHGVKSYYDAVECVAWQRSRLGKNARENAQTRMFTATAERNELKLRTERGLLVDREVVARDGRTFVKGLASKMRSLPRRLVQIGALSREHEPVATELVREILTEISMWKTGADVPVGE